MRWAGLLAFLKEPDPPKGMKDAWDKLPVFRKVLDMAPKELRNAPCQAVSQQGDEVDLTRLPIQTCWPEDAAPLITWGLVITRGPSKSRQNLGIYRMQLLGPNRLIMRWLAHRGGALDYREWQAAHPGEPFTGLCRPGCRSGHHSRRLLPRCRIHSRNMPSPGCFAAAVQRWSNAWNPISRYPPPRSSCLRGTSIPDDMAQEGPYGDHTGYYNEVERFPVFTVTRITHREEPIYHSTYTGRPPDEPAVLGMGVE